MTDKIKELGKGAALDCLIANGGWLPIEEAPKDGTEVLITDGYDKCTGRYRISNCSADKPYFCTTANGEDYNIGYDWKSERQYIPATHFMPLDTPERMAKVIEVLVEGLRGSRSHVNILHVVFEDYRKKNKLWETYSNMTGGIADNISDTLAEANKIAELPKGATTGGEG